MGFIFSISGIVNTLWGMLVNDFQKYLAADFVYFKKFVDCKKINFGGKEEDSFQAIQLCPLFRICECHGCYYMHHFNVPKLDDTVKFTY